MSLFKYWGGQSISGPPLLKYWGGPDSLDPPLVMLLREGRSLDFQHVRKARFLREHTVNGPSLLPLKTNKRANHAEKMA